MIAELIHSLSEFWSSTACFLVHFIWMGTAVWFVADFGLRWLRNASPEIRYLYHVATLILIVAAAGASLLVVISTHQTWAGVGAGDWPAEWFKGSIAVSLPILWLLGLAVMSVRMGLGLLGIRRLCSASTPLKTGDIHQSLLQHMETLRIKQPVSIGLCDRTPMPILAGIVHPNVMLPPAAKSWPPEHVELILLHELIHVRRWDNLITLAQRIIESLLWFHPAVRCVSDAIDQEREYCCDDLVVALTQRNDVYAEALVRLAKTNSPNVAAAFGRAPVSLRVRRILSNEELTMSGSINWKATALVASVVCILIMSGANPPESVAQSAPDPVQTEASDEAAGAEQAQENRVVGPFATIPQLFDFQGKSDPTEAIAVFGSAQKRPWGPEQVEGTPDTVGSGDIQTAWASMTTDSQEEWLVCEYEKPVALKAVRVHETYNPGALVKVSAFDKDGNEVVAWEGVDPTPREKPRGISVIPVKLDFKVQKIKVYIDSPSVPGWNEIDAVALEDEEGEKQWAQKVTASSTFAQAVTSAPVMLTAQQLVQLQGTIEKLREDVESLKANQSTAVNEEMKQLRKEVRELKELLQAQSKKD